MYLAALYVQFEIDTTIPDERERILRAIRDHIKNESKGRLALRLNEADGGLGISFFDDNFARLQSRAESLFEEVENAGEARVSSQSLQVFSWFEGRYTETRDVLDEDLAQKSKNDMGSKDSSLDRTIVYRDEDEAEGSFEPLPTRFSRRGLRLPVRK